MDWILQLLERSLAGIRTPRSSYRATFCTLPKCKEWKVYPNLDCQLKSTPSAQNCHLKSTGSTYHASPSYPPLSKILFLPSQLFNIKRLFLTLLLVLGIYTVPWSLRSSGPFHQVPDQIPIGSPFSGLPSPEQFSLWVNQHKLSRSSSGSWILLPSAQATAVKEWRSTAETADSAPASSFDPIFPGNS